MIFVEHFRRISLLITATLLAFGTDLESAIQWPDLLIDFLVILAYLGASCF